MKPVHPLFRHPESGSALVITLSLTVLMTIILIAAFANVQFSSQLSRSRFDAFTAGEYAQDGTEQAIGLLRYATGEKTTYWITQPGAVQRFPLGTNTTPTETVALHSGVAGPGEDSVDLNAPSIQTPTEGRISAAVGDIMPVRWINIRADGTLDTSPTYNAQNRIVGRYAFWTDDESTKINVNTAWTRSAANTKSASHPSRIPLSYAIPGLTESDANKIAQYRDITGPFNSTPELLRSFGIDADQYASDLQTAQFWLSHFSASPTGLTYFGEPKIVLTTQKRRATAPNGTLLPFLDVYANSDWGNGNPSGDIDQTKVIATVDLLVRYLSRSDWPMEPGKTFQDKLYYGNVDRLKQLAINIMEYVRLKETPPLEATSSPHQSAVIRLDNFRAFTRSVFITEAGAWAPSFVPDVLNTFYFWCELYLPNNMGIAEIDLNTITTFNSLTGNDPNEVPARKLSPSEYISNTGGEPKNVLKAGEYVVLHIAAGAFNWQLSGSKLYTPLRLFTPPVNHAFCLDSLPPAETAFPENFPIPITRGVPDEIANIQTVSIDDPALNDRSENWQVVGNSLGAPNFNRTVERTPTDLALEQDLDDDGKITDAGIVLPAPAGVTIVGSPSSNPNGIVESLAELGYIHTGIQCLGTTSGDLGATHSGNVPWRTLHLQPRHPNASQETLPDWAMLDLFTLPLPAETDRVHIPSSISRGGLLNLNSSIKPFTTIHRDIPWRAAFTGLSGFSSPDIMATNIRDFTLATSPYAQGRTYTPDKQFLFPSQLAEIKGIADQGEQSEQNLRGLIDLASVRGSVFSIVSVGQSIAQDPSGRITVRAEARQLSIVERHEENGAIIFRTILNKPLDY